MKTYSISVEERLMKKADKAKKEHFKPSRSAFISEAILYYLKHLKDVNS